MNVSKSNGEVFGKGWWWMNIATGEVSVGGGNG